MAFLEVLLFLVGVIYLIYRWTTATYGCFDERVIPFEKPFPFMGNNFRVIMNKESIITTVINMCAKFRAYKVFGFYNFRDPIYVINDPDSIKKITIKDFEYFPNHKPFFNTKSDPLLNGMLTIMKDQRWKNMRNTLSPVFTASKMRSMFALMNESFDECLRNLHAKAPKGSGQKHFDLEMKQFFTRLSNDIIASTAFGLKVNSYKDTNNEFYQIGQSITNFRGAQLVKFMFSSAAPKLMEFLGFEIFDKSKTDYFMRLVVDAMKYREENNIVRPDMIQLLMEAKKESAENWSNEDLVAQCFIFFFAAFENNANLICTACVELALNPDIQERLFEEVQQIREGLNGAPLDYDVVAKMKYMDMVLSETLRKCSLAPFTDRVCSKDYKLKDEEGNLIVELKAGDQLWIPIAGFHWNEEYFPNPEVFDPERFSDENKDKIKPFTYLPFGVGPRNCIGNRYALMQGKAMLYQLLLNFKLQPMSKTVKDIFGESRGFQITPPNGFWLRFVNRET